MTLGTMTVDADKGSIKSGNADDGDAEESEGKHNNQTGTGVGADDDDAWMWLSWMTGAHGVDNRSADDNATGKNTVNSGG